MVSQEEMAGGEGENDFNETLAIAKLETEMGVLLFLKYTQVVPAPGPLHILSLVSQILCALFFHSLTSHSESSSNLTFPFYLSQASFANIYQ